MSWAAAKFSQRSGRPHGPIDQLIKPTAIWSFRSVNLLAQVNPLPVPGRVHLHSSIAVDDSSPPIRSWFCRLVRRSAWRIRRQSRVRGSHDVSITHKGDEDSRLWASLRVSRVAAPRRGRRGPTVHRIHCRVPEAMLRPLAGAMRTRSPAGLPGVEGRCDPSQGR